MNKSMTFKGTLPSHYESWASPRPVAVVTGGNGYLGGWVIVELLRRGYDVRATVRDVTRSDGVRKAIGSQVSPAGLSFAQADLTDDHGWTDIMLGADTVLHLASPLPVAENLTKDMIGPAREGTLRVLSAANESGVRRIVVTSSANAAKPPDPSAVIREEVWTDLSDGSVQAYARSKALAEQAAWALADQPGFHSQIVTILPTAIIGPVLAGATPRSSVGVIALMLAGKMAGIPNYGWNIADVRDVADLHVRAINHPAAAGKRFVAGGEFMWWHDMAALLRTELGSDGSKAPKRKLPDMLVRLGAKRNPELRQIAAGLGQRTPVDSSRAEKLLDWKARQARDSVLDAGRSLIHSGIPITRP